jgi:hypothetical protein
MFRVEDEASGPCHIMLESHERRPMVGHAGMAAPLAQPCTPP